MRKRTLSLMLILVLLLSFSLSVSAREVPDFSRLGSISIAMTHDGKPVPGGSLIIFRVAAVADDNGDMVFVYTDDFSGCSIPVTELNSARLPEELARIAESKQLKGIPQELNSQGKTKFTDLQIGLYLVFQKKAAPGYTKINPFLVSVPQNDDGHYVYDVDTAPKNIPGPEVKPTEPKPTQPTKPDDDKLPQTGQTNWPVPVLAVAGMLLLIGGFCMRVSGKRKQDEA